MSKNGQLQVANRMIAHFLEANPGIQRRLFLKELVSSALAAASCYGRGMPSSTAGLGRLRLKLFDADTGLPVPARLHVELPDGSHWTPVGYASGHVHDEGSEAEILTGHNFGPMLAPAKCSLDWTCLSSGEAYLELPSGRSRLFISKGFEYLPLRVDAEVQSGRTVLIERGIKRWVNMPARGYFSGDIHQHFTRKGPQDDRLWETLARAEDLHVINTMVLRHGEPDLRYTQYAYGDKGVHQAGHHVIVPGEEFRDNDLSGHLTIAGNQEIIAPVSTGPQLGLQESYPPFAAACREARKMGAIVGWAHGGLAGVTEKTLGDLTPRGLESVSVEAVLGLIDFIEVVQFASFLGEPFWYRLLGSGVQLAGIGGTDFPFGIWLAPWYPTFGQERTYAAVEGQFTHRTWFDGIRRGRVFSTNGPMIWLHVEGVGCGDTIRFSRSRQVRISARAECAHPLDVLEILLNGTVVATARPERGQSTIKFTGRIALDRSSWISARARGRVAAQVFGGRRDWPLIAHAGIVYAYIGQKPIRILSDLRWLFDCTTRFRSVVKEKGVFSTEEHRTEFLRNIDEAILIYKERLRESQ